MRILRGVWAFIRYLPPSGTRELLSQMLTIYGFWVGIWLAVAAIVLYFDFARVTIAPKLEAESTSEIKVEVIWEGNYKPPKEIEQALQNLLTGEAYTQPVWDYEYDEFDFPQSVSDLPSVPRPVPAGELLFLKWRIGTTPPLPPDEAPLEALLPLTDERWEWNVAPELMTYIATPPHDVRNKVEWYKIAIAMVGGYSKLFSQGLPTDESKAAIDAFGGAVWTFEVKYLVWNSGKTPAKLCKIIPAGGDTSIGAPEGIDSDEFVIQPGSANRLAFKLTPKNQFSTLGSAESQAAEVREKTKVKAPPSEEMKGSPWHWVVGAVVVGIICATITKRVFRYRHLEH